MGELFDIHVHLPDPATFPEFAAEGKKRILMRLLLRRMRQVSDFGRIHCEGKSPLPPLCKGGDFKGGDFKGGDFKGGDFKGGDYEGGDFEAGLTREHVVRHNREMIHAIEASMLDRAVLLALDAPHDEDGTAMTRGGALICDNDYIAALCGTSGKTLFGASIHPYRKDALRQLERCIENGACLVKWIPSAQNIDPLNERCLPFFEMLAAHRLPLLCHTGIEHTLPGRNNDLNDPLRLIPALKSGVTVIAAHCGARMLLHERSHFDSWRRMALQHENFYGDISGFVIPTRMHLLSRLTRDETLLSKALYGSDFPGFADLFSCLFKIGVRRTLALRREDNPFSRPLRALREMGLPEAVFSRAGGLLRMSAPREVTP